MPGLNPDAVIAAALAAGRNALDALCGGSEHALNEVTGAAHARRVRYIAVPLPGRSGITVVTCSGARR
jgi:hypothetical protein